MFSKMYLVCLVIGVIFSWVNVTVRCREVPPDPIGTNIPPPFPPSEMEEPSWQSDELGGDLTTFGPPPPFPPPDMDKTSWETYEFDEDFTTVGPPPPFPPREMDVMSWQPEESEQDLTTFELSILPDERNDLISNSVLEGKIG